MTIETLQHPETQTIYRIYRWSEDMGEWEWVADFFDQSEALVRYAEALKYNQQIKLTKVTTQDLLIKGE